MRPARPRPRRHPRGHPARPPATPSGRRRAGPRDGRRGRPAAAAARSACTDRPRPRARRAHVRPAGRRPTPRRSPHRRSVGRRDALAQLVALGSRRLELAGRIGGRLPRRGHLLRRPLGPLTGATGRPLQLLRPGGRLGGVGLGPCPGGLRPLHLGPQRRQLGTLATGLGLRRLDAPLERLGRALVGGRLRLLLDECGQLGLPALRAVQPQPRGPVDGVVGGHGGDPLAELDVVLDHLADRGQRGGRQLLELQERPQRRRRRDGRPLAGPDDGDDERDLQPRSEEVVGRVHRVIVPTALTAEPDEIRARDACGTNTCSLPCPPVQRSFDELGTPLAEVTFAVVDLETTGGSPNEDAITEIGAVKVRGGECLGTFHTLGQPRLGHPARHHGADRHHRGDGGARASRARGAAGAGGVPRRHRRRRPQHPLRPRLPQRGLRARRLAPLAQPVGRHGGAGPPPRARRGAQLPPRHPGRPLPARPQAVAPRPRRRPGHHRPAPPAAGAGGRVGRARAGRPARAPPAHRPPAGRQAPPHHDAPPLARRVLVRRRPGRPPLRGQGRQPAPAGPVVLLRGRPAEDRQPPAGDGRRAPPRRHVDPRGRGRRGPAHPPAPTPLQPPGHALAGRAVRRRSRSASGSPG